MTTNPPMDGAQFELHKMQLIGSLNAVAASMRSCAEYADQFAHMLGTGPNPMSPPHMAAPPVGFDPKLYAANPNFVAYMQQQQQQQQVAPAAVARNGKRKAGEVDGAVEDGGKKKRGPIKKPKDPNAPKRPASSYIYFQNEIRNQLKQEFPTISQPELLARISKRWGELTPVQKEVYEKRQATAKAQYETDKAAYEANHDVSHDNSPSSPIVPATPAPVPASPEPEQTRPTKNKKTLPATPSSDSEGEGTSSGTSSSGSSTDSEDSESEETPPPKPKKSKKGKQEAPATPAPPPPVVVSPKSEKKEKKKKSKKPKA